MAAQFGGAIAPLLVAPIQMRYGWRTTFYLFGARGIVWSAIWYWWFRDSPWEMAGISAEELEETCHLPAPSHHGLPWKSALRSRNLWVGMGITFATSTCWLSAPGGCTHGW
jgi:ACS family glucarate transporter-like MFS transporter